MNQAKLFIKHRILEILAVIGLIDSIYLALTGTHFIYFENMCTETCGQDLIYFGLHVSTYGIIYYFLLLCFGFFKKIKYGLILSGIGTIISFYFLYHQIVIIKGICIFCLISLICTVLYFSTNIFFRIKKY